MSVRGRVDARNPLRELRAQGQSVWLDFIDRALLVNGRLERLIEGDGVSGLTSNPTIFEKAIAGTRQYDAAIRRVLAQRPSTSAQKLYETLVVEDIRMAADLLRPIHDATRGADGFACLEVSPHLAYDEDATVEEARRLHAIVDRPNVMIKVPGTREGLLSIEQLAAEGIPVNVTLLFSVEQYDAAARAYLRGVERAREPVPSVASVFVSRIDGRVDALLHALGAPGADALRGRASIAVAKRIYARSVELLATEPFARSRGRGAFAQRVLWASTSTKDPTYSDVRYVEALVAPSTVTTLPMETLEAFRDHGRVVGATAAAGAAQAREMLDSLEAFGIRYEDVALGLQRDGAQKFADSFDKLLAALERKRSEELAHA